MLAVHEEKIANQEEAQSRANTEFTNDIKELHSRVTSNYKELTDMITQHHKEQAHLQMQQIKNDLNSRVGVLEKMEMVNHRWFYRSRIYHTKISYIILTTHT